MAKLLKGLTKELIKVSKDEELHFSKEEIKNIKESARVTYEKRDNGNWTLTVYTKYYDSCCGGYYWKGSFSWYANTGKGNMEIFSGFTGNPIGQVRERYTCERPDGTNYQEEFKTVLSYMKSARFSSNADSKSYCDFVAKTGCLD